MGVIMSMPEMTEMTAPDVAFPAIARATRRFLVRSGRQEDARVTSHADKGAEETDLAVSQLMLKLGLDLDRDLLLVRHDVRKIHEAIAREHERVCELADAFTAALASGCAFDMPTLHSKRTVRVRSIRQPHRPSHGRRTARLVLKAPRREQHAHSEVSESSVEKTRPLSRVARLGKEATCAAVIQKRLRRFLYTQLYRGGPYQLHMARILRKRSEFRRWMRRWRCFLGRMRRLRRKLERRAAGLEGELLERCIVRADAVAEIDGKYGQAKEFHRLRWLGVAMAAWLRVVTCRGAE